MRLKIILFVALTGVTLTTCKPTFILLTKGFLRYVLPTVVAKKAGLSGLSGLTGLTGKTGLTGLTGLTGISGVSGVGGKGKGVVKTSYVEAQSPLHSIVLPPSAPASVTYISSPLHHAPAGFGQYGPPLVSSGFSEYGPPPVSSGFSQYGPPLPPLPPPPPPPPVYGGPVF